MRMPLVAIVCVRAGVTVGSPRTRVPASTPLTCRRAWLSVLAMVEDANEGTFGSPPPSGNFLRITPAASLGQLSYPVAPESQQAWDAADAAVKAIVEKDGLGQQLLWRGTRNVQCA